MSHELRFDVWSMFFLVSSFTLDACKPMCCIEPSGKSGNAACVAIIAPYGLLQTCVGYTF